MSVVYSLFGPRGQARGRTDGRTLGLLALESSWPKHPTVNVHINVNVNPCTPPHPQRPPPPASPPPPLTAPLLTFAQLLSSECIVCQITRIFIPGDPRSLHSALGNERYNFLSDVVCIAPQLRDSEITYSSVDTTNTRMASVAIPPLSVCLCLCLSVSVSVCLSVSLMVIYIYI